MPRPSRIWYKSSHRCWYVKHGGKLIRLDPDPEKARAMYSVIVQPGSLEYGSPVVVARLMGHATVQMGYSHYSGFEVGTLSEAVDRA